MRTMTIATRPNRRAAALCVTAKLARLCRLWVNRYTSTSQRRTPNVRFTPNSDHSLAPQRSDARAQFQTHAPQLNLWAELASPPHANSCAAPLGRDGGGPL
jgi:hypothetical protein